MIKSYRLVRCAIAGPGRRSALYGRVQKCNGDFLGCWYISGKIFMKMWSAVIGTPVLVFGGGMRNTDDFQNIMRTFLALDKNFKKIQSVVIEILGELLYPWVLAEVCTLQMVFKV